LPPPTSRCFCCSPPSRTRRGVNEKGAAAFSAALPTAAVRWVEDATHSLVTDERERFGANVVEWLSEEL